MKKIFVILSATLVITSGTIAFAQSGNLKSERPVVDAKPVLLPWRTISWPKLEFSRETLSRGGALYQMQDASEKKFRVEIVFAGGTFALPEKDRPAYGAMVDLLLMGGAGKRSFQDIQNFTLAEGLNVETKVGGTGGLEVSMSGLNKDFLKGLQLLEDVLLRPRFDPAALELWKQMESDEFSGILDASNSRKQQSFVQQETARLLFGNNHFYSRSLFRRASSALNSVSLAKIKELYPQAVNASGLRVLTVGSMSKQNETALVRVLGKIPHKGFPPIAWMPERPALSPAKKVRVVVVRKDDLTQSNVLYQRTSLSLGEPNTLERIRLAVLGEIFSSSGGVVGNDRFSKALRADSGLSYSPHAQHDDDFMAPNTNVSTWKMSFQSPNESVGRALEIAQKTWQDFQSKGVSNSELDRARIALMNRMMGQELTLNDKAGLAWSAILQDRLPRTGFLEHQLAQLELESDPAKLNSLLRHYSDDVSAGTVVIFGNPPPDEVKKIKALSNFELVKDISFKSLVDELKSDK
jgi:zinc protease